jgi:hypothetical protein
VLRPFFPSTSGVNSHRAGTALRRLWPSFGGPDFAGCWLLLAIPSSGDRGTV